MPMDRSKYPDDWSAISLHIRERDGNACKWCGVKNGAIGARDRRGVWHDQDDMDSMSSSQGFHLWPDGWPKIIKIVLTVHHLPEATSKMDCRDEVLVSLCQRCHLSADRPHHIANARETRLTKRDKQPRLEGITS